MNMSYRSFSNSKIGVHFFGHIKGLRNQTLPWNPTLMYCCPGFGRREGRQHAFQSRRLFHLSASWNRKTCFPQVLSLDPTEQLFVLLLGCVSSQSRCLPQGAFGSHVFQRQPCFTHVSGKKFALQGFLLWCQSVLRPVWSYPLKAQEYLSLSVFLKSTNTSFLV